MLDKTLTANKLTHESQLPQTDPVKNSHGKTENVIKEIVITPSVG